MKFSEIQAFTQALDMLRDFATDEQAVEAKNAYPAWKENVEYQIGKRVVYNNVLYKVLKGHTSQADIAPGSQDDLYKKL